MIRRTSPGCASVRPDGSARRGTPCWRCSTPAAYRSDDITVREYLQFNQVGGLTNGDVDLITDSATSRSSSRTAG